MALFIRDTVLALFFYLSVNLNEIFSYILTIHSLSYCTTYICYKGSDRKSVLPFFLLSFVRGLERCFGVRPLTQSLKKMMLTIKTVYE